MHTHLKSNHNEPLLEPRSRSLMIWCIEELTVILHRTYDTVMTEMQEYKAKSKEKCLLSYKDASLEDINELQSAPRVRIRGHPKNRLGLNTEKQIANTLKKKKKKAPSELNLLDGKLVVQLNFNLYYGQIMNY
ncbi:hypothetical protein Ahy_B10g104194 [Arachis hypogaea]|uniref:Protein FAR1-RELATED SEQUENCE n=1 Tax=Arachis hypogaea TaxID=3818 RepID=A0A444X4Y5_ARAHY|nr:hypothetical protein Ahy_B10g104194 [Arachis hypogaea]